MGSFSIWHWLIVLLVVVLIFGTKKLKNIGSDLGSAVKGFKDGVKGSGEVVGRFDARVKAPARDRLSNFAEGDPSFDVAWGPFSTLINDYLGRELKASGPQVYEVLGGGGGPWNYGATNAFARADDRLVSALARNPRLKVLVQCGTFDLATPPDSILHTIGQLDLPAPLRANLSIEFYEGGHMFYLDRAASAKMRADLLRFIAPT